MGRPRRRRYDGGDHPGRDARIFENREAVILHEGLIAANQQEIKVLKDATLNNMVNNVFLKNFDSVEAVLIVSGIFDPVARKIYV